MTQDKRDAEFINQHAAHLSRLLVIQGSEMQGTRPVTDTEIIDTLDKITSRTGAIMARRRARIAAAVGGA